jgi:cytidine deaminase
MDSGYKEKFGYCYRIIGGDILDKKELIKRALEAQTLAYVPYSNFHVGAAVLTEDDTIFKAISEGHTNIKAIAIVGDSNPTFPCGVCRQVIREFGKDAKIIIANSADNYKMYTLDELLPHSFGPEDLDNKLGE